MEEADAKEMAQFTPIERLQHITEYIMNAYADELKNKMTDFTIHFHYRPTITKTNSTG